GVDVLERHHACQCHRTLPSVVTGLYAVASSARAATVRQLRCVAATPRRRSSRAAESRAIRTPAPYWTETSLPASTPTSGEGSSAGSRCAAFAEGRLARKTTCDREVSRPNG